MKPWNYHLLRMAVGFVLFILSILPTGLLVAGVVSLLPAGAEILVVALVGIPWVLGMMIGTHMITEKLSKRWSH